MKKYKISLDESCDDDTSLSFRSEDGLFKNKSGLKIHVVTKKEPVITKHYPTNISNDYRFVIEDLVKNIKNKE